MKIVDIEALPDVKATANVLKQLEAHGIDEASIAGGWTRNLLTGAESPDIDVSYVGTTYYKDAQLVLAKVLDEINPANKDIWDIKGIWNAEIAYGVKHTVDNYLRYYLNSIDTVYLASDGKLHDPTGYGFQDAETKTLRINDYDLINRTTTAYEEVNVCLENCRRLAKFAWKPTDRSVERISGSVNRWNELTVEEKNYFINKLKSKYPDTERSGAKVVFSIYGWGFVFDI